MRKWSISVLVFPLGVSQVHFLFTFFSLAGRASYSNSTNLSSTTIWVCLPSYFCVKVTHYYQIIFSLSLSKLSPPARNSAPAIGAYTCRTNMFVFSSIFHLRISFSNWYNLSLFTRLLQLQHNSFKLRLLDLVPFFRKLAPILSSPLPSVYVS